MTDNTKPNKKKTPEELTAWRKEHMSRIGKLPKRTGPRPLKDGYTDAQVKNRIKSRLNFLLHASEEDQDAVIDSVLWGLMEKAKEGNIQAIEMLLAYTVGKPKDNIELSGTASPLACMILPNKKDKETEEEQ